MKTKRILIPSLLALATAFALEAAEISTTGPKPASAGVVNDWLREQNGAFAPWDIGGELRARVEHKANFATAGIPGTADFLRVGGNRDNSYILFREKVHIGYKPADWFQVFAEGRDSSSHGDDRNPNPEADHFDLHQAYVRIGGNLERCPVTLQAGRQHLIYGDERLIGSFGWSNLERVFDAAKLRYETDSFWVDAFTGRVVLVDANNFNVANDYDWFSGLYTSSRTICPKQETQLYFLARNTSANSPTANVPAAPQAGGPGARDIYTLGTRVKSLPGEFGAWDYDAEVAWQMGTVNTAGGRRDHRALASHVGGGYSWADTWGTPRIGAEYNYASGDDNPTDGSNDTFDNLFPTNHKFYGQMDLVSWQNTHNLGLITSLKPHARLSLSLNWHSFWLATDQDFSYVASQVPRAGAPYGINTGAGKFLGSELDLMASFKICPQATLQGGYGHFFTGPYVNDSLRGAGGSRDADFLYAQLTVKF